MDQNELFPFERLDREHLIYELTIRGVKNVSSKLKNDHGTLAKILSYMLRREQTGREYDSEIILDSVNTDRIFFSS